jgi:DDE superfamily endonuclease
MAEKSVEICKLYAESQKLYEQDGTMTVSTDEKTGIQALERLAATKPMQQKRVEAREFEYKRHGTQALIATFNVVKGDIIAPTIGDTRREDDFVKHIEAVVATKPATTTWRFALDQLNTHKSASLVESVAKLCGITTDLGVKGESGILHNMQTRMEFLADPTHRIRFVFTPVHASWLNQVEIWFGILAKKLLNRGNFTSKQDLNDKIAAFIDFFNKTMAKPFKWTYKGKILTA